MARGPRGEREELRGDGRCVPRGGPLCADAGAGDPLLLRRTRSAYDVPRPELAPPRRPGLDVAPHAARLADGREGTRVRHRVDLEPRLREGLPARAAGGALLLLPCADALR